MTNASGLLNDRYDRTSPCLRVESKDDFFCTDATTHFRELRKGRLGKERYTMYRAMILGTILIGMAIPLTQQVARSASPGPAIQFFSQNGSWKCDQLGTCAGTTIGDCGSKTPGGCLMTCVAMGLKSRGADVSPANLNKWLRDNSGFQNGCLINCSTAATYDGTGGLTWVGTGTLKTPADLKKVCDEAKYVIARSSRFSNHWGAIRGYRNDGSRWSDFLYWDPWDTTPTTRQLGDGWIGAGAETRIFK